MEYSQCVQTINRYIEKILKDPKLARTIQKISHKTQGDIVFVIESYIIKKIAKKLFNYIQHYNIKLVRRRKRNMILYDVYLDYNPDEENTSLGILAFNIELVSGELLLTLDFMNDESQEQYSYSISNLIQKLLVPAKPKVIKFNLIENTMMIKIDFEWLQSYGQVEELSSMVTEYGMVYGDNYYYSDALWLHPSKVRSVNKHLLRLMDTTKEELLERHSEAKQGMLVEWSNVVTPILDTFTNMDIGFISFGDTDHTIIKELIYQKYEKRVKYYDFRDIYYTQLGQESLLLGLGVNFIHQFHAGEDAKGLALLVDIFKETDNLYEVQMFEYLIRLNKNIVLENNIEKSEFYMQLFLQDERVKELWKLKDTHIECSPFEFSSTKGHL